MSSDSLRQLAVDGLRLAQMLNAASRPPDGRIETLDAKDAAEMRALETLTRILGNPAFPPPGTDLRVPDDDATLPLLDLRAAVAAITSDPRFVYVGADGYRVEGGGTEPLASQAMIARLAHAAAELAAALGDMPGPPAEDKHEAADEQTDPATRAIALMARARRDGRRCKMKDLALAVGCSRWTLRRDPLFMAAWSAYRMGDPPPDGERDENGNLEAWEDG